VTARLLKDQAKRLSPDERKKAYADRFRPQPPPLPVLSNPLAGREDIATMRAEEITPRHLMLLARRNTLPVLERLYELAMMDHKGNPEMARVCVLAAGSFLNRAGLYEVKGQVATIYAKVERDQAKIEEFEREAAREKRVQTVEVEKLTEGLGPTGPML
jgi:hypothetical protein